MANDESFSNLCIWSPAELILTLSLEWGTLLDPSTKATHNAIGFPPKLARNQGGSLVVSEIPNRFFCFPFHVQNVSKLVVFCPKGAAD